jgi:hypothetical protein
VFTIINRPSANPDINNNNKREAISVNPREPNFALSIVCLLINCTSSQRDPV